MRKRRAAHGPAAGFFQTPVTAGRLWYNKK